MPNRLQYETSPYLLQHAQNPVDWYSWGEEAFRKAREEDKPVFLSIGYSTCHWCHVMARESFEDAGIAELLNQYFISIKKAELEAAKKAILEQTARKEKLRRFMNALALCEDEVTEFHDEIFTLAIDNIQVKKGNKTVLVFCFNDGSEITEHITE